HGKTTLVKALTGVDTDRLEEEQRRGISIELGFARMDVGDVRFGIVDVPGHERFVRNMLAGVGGIDLVMLVIAADEGVMPQTREHLDIIDFLGIERGIIALTKCDLVDEESQDIAVLDVEEVLEGTVLEGAPVVRVSSTTGDGMDDLKAMLLRLAEDVTARPDDGPYRLPVDRVFTMEGFGTVVTGTGFSGSAAVGDRLELLPSGRPVRVRRVQVHGVDVERAGTGQRTALALHGVSKDQVARGEQLVTPGSLTPVSMIDVRVRVSPRWVRPVRNRERIRFHLGASEDLGRIIFLDRDELVPGEDALAQIRMETPIVPALGDRFVLRSYSPMVTMAGGTIVDPHPTKHRRYREEELAAIEKREGGGPIAIVLEAAVAAGLGGVKPKALAEATSLSGEEIRALVAGEQETGSLRTTAGGRVVSEDVWRLARRTVTEHGEQFRERHPLRWGVTRAELRQVLGGSPSPAVLGELLDELAAEGAVELREEQVRVGGGEVVFEGAAARERDRVEALYRAAGFAPPDRRDVIAGSADPDLTHDVLAALQEQQLLEKLDEELFYHRDAWNDALAVIRNLHAAAGSISVGDVRDKLGISRKFAVPLMERMDAKRITRRDGDVRTLLKTE
ncbi:MAG: selenocysteine-specific translation elongation factor, partial [Gemmatimonadetes bacterium]|nr:selenocysteine-specific translation elongation factor [Gemmatimonadota bacterium]